MKKLDPLSWFMIVGSLVMVLVMIDRLPSRSTGHQCRWSLCPYKGTCTEHAAKAVFEYVGEKDTDGYCIDMLHFQYPSLDADQLDSLLFTTKK